MNERNELGQGLAEYAMLISLIAMVALYILAVFGSQVGGLYTTLMHYLLAI